MALFGLIGNDRKLAATTYSGRESASDAGRRGRIASHKRNAPANFRKGQAWEDAERRRQDGGGRRGRWFG